MKTELTSQNIGKTVFYSDERYNDELEKYEVIYVKGIIDSLLIDINFGAYGYKVRSIYGDCNFIIKNENTKNLIGNELNELNWIKE